MRVKRYIIPERVKRGIEQDMAEIERSAKPKGKVEADSQQPQLATEEGTPPAPEHFEDCQECQGTGLVGDDLCSHCAGSGKALPSA